jgi:hypothetical protein
MISRVTKCFIFMPTGTRSNNRIHSVYRLDEEVFVSSQMDDLVMHLIDTLNLKEHVLKSSSEPLREYSVVVDLTWCTPPQSLKNGKEILRTISFIEPFFPSGYSL